MTAKGARAGVSLLALLCSATPTLADLKLNLSGYAREYAVYADNDEVSTPAAGDSVRRFVMKRYTGVMFSGETKLDNGVTVGVFSEFKLGNEQDDGGVASITSGGRDPNQFDQGYIYFSGNFGRIDFGSKEGAAYTLDVAAPSADSNVDGMRVYVQGWNPDVWDDGLVNASYLPVGATVRLSYDNSDFGKVDRITYMTPKWNGFQAGVSYAPENSKHGVDSALAGMTLDDRLGKFEHLFDAAAKWDTKIGDVKIAAGAGYSNANVEMDRTPGNNGSDNMKTWDAGLNLGWKEVSLGGNIKHSNTGVAGPANDLNVWVVGAAWDRKPWHAGISFYDLTYDANAFSIGLADSLELQRTTVGGSYQFAPGMSLRATIARMNVDNGVNAPVDPHQTQVAFGTDLAF